MSSSGTTQEVVEDPEILEKFAVESTRIVNGEGKASLKFTGMTKDMERCKYKIRIASRDGSPVEVPPTTSSFSLGCCERRLKLSVKDLTGGTDGGRGRWGGK